MLTYTQSQARRDLKLGYLTRWRIDRASTDGCWVVMLGEGHSAGWLCETRNKALREFKSLDGAVSALQSIGFEINSLFQG